MRTSRCIGDASRSRWSRYNANTALDRRWGLSPLPETHMLKWAIIFAIVSLVTGWLGFGGLSGATAMIAKVLFGIFVVLFLLAVLAIVGVLRLF
jgi:uncharacterized membrane protein YtjA (UPF0391 family)